MQQIAIKGETELDQLEAVIRENLGAFYEVGRALMEIRDRELYKIKKGGNYQTFEAYCKGEWDFNRRYAYYLIDSASVIENVNNCAQIPTTESQTRSLAKLEPEKQREVWQKAVESAPEGKVTAAHISKTVKKMTESEKSTRNIKKRRPKPKEEIFTEGFKEAFDKFFYEIQNAKMEKWKNTTEEAALYYIGLLTDLITIS